MESMINHLLHPLNLPLGKGGRNIRDAAYRLNLLIDLEKNMAKRVMDRKALRAQAEAAERRDSQLEGEDTEVSAGDDEDGAKKKKKTTKVKEKSATAKPKKTKRASKASIRMRIVWTVYNNSNQAVAKYDYPRKAEAEAHRDRLMKEKNVTHFIMPVKEPMVIDE